MIKSKAIDLLKTFNEEELRQFGFFTESPYFNRESVQVKLYSLLKKHYPLFEGKNLTKEKLFEKLYPGKKYNDGVMRNNLSKLLELAENFLTLRQMQNDKFDFELTLMQLMSRRQVDKLYLKAEQNAQKLLEAEQYKDDRYYYNRFRFNNEKRLFSRNKKSTLYLSNEIEKQGSDNISISFLITMLRSFTDIANSNMKMFQFEAPGSLDEFEKYADTAIKNYGDIEYLQYYYNSFKLAKTQDEKYYFRLKELANSSYSKFSEKDRRDLFTILTNFCYFKVNSGDLGFRTEQFLLLKENFERGHYKGIRNYVDHISYLNVIVTGLDAGETEWVENFILKYKPELDDSNRENSFNFANALVYYKKQKYSEALNEAAKVKTDDLSYKHQLKSLYLKIYFEMNEIEPFYSHVDSYRHFLLNEKHIPEHTRHVINSYVNFTKKLFDIKLRNTSADYGLHKLRLDIKENKAMINKPWLLDKIAEAEKDLLKN